MIRLRMLLLAAAIAPFAGSAQTTGFTPLSDLGTGTYQGFEGGLYPGGLNTPPAGHAAAALLAAQGVVPRDAAGNPDPANGRIAMVSIGMSNTTYEFAVFERQEDQNVGRNARVVICNGAVGGQDTTAIADPTAPYWTIVQDRLTALGLANAQVQVAWLKEAKANPTGGFPAGSQALRDQFRTIVQILHSYFPNLRLCYLSSRIFAGYASPSSINPEPYAYESGFAVKWLIVDQINGDPGLNYDPANGTVMAPLLLWGPYLWADGGNPRSDGLIWVPADYLSDMIHPSASGQQKVADMLTAFFAVDPPASYFWPKQGGLRLVTVDATDDSYVAAASPGGNFGGAMQLYVQGGASPMNTYVRFDVSAVPRPAWFAKVGFRVDTSAGGDLGVVANAGWDESTITYGSAPAIGASFVTIPLATRNGTMSADATGQVNGDADGIVSFGLTTTATGQGTCVSKEGGMPPRLTLVVPDASDDYLVGAGLGAPNPNEVKVFTPGGAPAGVDFFAYAAGQWGVNVAAADSGASMAIVTGPGPGAVYGPQVRGWQRDGTPVAKVSFYAYGTLRYGVNVAGGSVDGDATDEMLTGAGPGAVFGPHVRGFDFDGGSVSSIGKVSFFAYGTLRYGVNTAPGDIDGDGFAEILTGAGPSAAFGPHVRGFDYDGAALASMAKVNFNAGTGTHGINVGAEDVDDDGYHEIATAAGPGPTMASRFLGYGYDASSVAGLVGFDNTPFPTLYGGRVGMGDIDGDGRADLCAGAGRDPAADATVRTYAYSGSALTPLGAVFLGFTATTFGVNVTGAALGF